MSTLAEEIEDIIVLDKFYIFILLYKGKLAKAWGLGGEFKHHSKLV